MYRMIFAAFAMLCMMGFADAAFAGSVVGSDHDLSAIAGSRQHAGQDFNDYNEVCVYCHTPHGADPAVPLWNRDIYQGNYTLYDSTVSQTFDATPEQPSLTGVTRMCLSCHDGTIAVDALVNEPNKPFGVSANHMRMSTDTSPDSCNSCHSSIDNGTTIDVQPSFVGTDLTDDHPVSFQYNSSLLLLDQGLEDPTVAPSGLGGTIQNDMLVNDRVECSSCHNVHDPDIYPFLIKPNVNSSLCVTCHKK